MISILQNMEDKMGKKGRSLCGRERELLSESQIVKVVQLSSLSIIIFTPFST